MLLKHVALFCKSEEKSDKFYGDLLGLKKENSKVLSKSISEQIFGLSIELKIINYTDNNNHFEIFIGDRIIPDHKKIEHICLEVDDREAFIKKCETMRVDINKVPRENSFILFINDYDGNLFEIKER